MVSCLTRCAVQHEYKCGGWLDSTGEFHATCGEPCSFVMMKGGAGNPPFRQRSQIYVGDVPVGPLED